MSSSRNRSSLLSTVGAGVAGVGLGIGALGGSGLGARGEAWIIARLGLRQRSALRSNVKHDRSPYV